MSEIRELAMKMSQQIKEMMLQDDRYREYQEARKAIYADEYLYKKVKDFCAKHINFLYAMKNGTATFEEERYLSQEFHKLMLKKNVYTYFTTGLYYVETLAEIYSTSIQGIELDLEFVEVR